MARNQKALNKTWVQTYIGLFTTRLFFSRRFGAPRFGGSRTGPLSGKKFGNPGEKLVKKKWNLDELPKFEKNFYQEHPDLARRTAVSNGDFTQLMETDRCLANV